MFQVFSTQQRRAAGLGRGLDARRSHVRGRVQHGGRLARHARAVYEHSSQRHQHLHQGYVLGHLRCYQVCEAVLRNATTS